MSSVPEMEWKPVKTLFCDRVGEEVALEARVVYPPDVLPDRPRVLAHRCSQGLVCNSFDRPGCRWSGGWPAFDPLA